MTEQRLAALEAAVRMLVKYRHNGPIKSHEELEKRIENKTQEIMGTAVNIPDPTIGRIAMLEKRVHDLRQATGSDLLTRTALLPRVEALEKHFETWIDSAGPMRKEFGDRVKFLEEANNNRKARNREFDKRITRMDEAWSTISDRITRRLEKVEEMTQEALVFKKEDLERDIVLHQRCEAIESRISVLTVNFTDHRDAIACGPEFNGLANEFEERLAKSNTEELEVDIDDGVALRSIEHPKLFEDLKKDWPPERQRMVDEKTEELFRDLATTGQAVERVRIPPEDLYSDLQEPVRATEGGVEVLRGQKGLTVIILRD